MVRVSFEKVDPRFPAFRHEKGDAGYDLFYIGENTTIKAISPQDINVKEDLLGNQSVSVKDENMVYKLPTNLRLKMPGQLYAEVKNRSGLGGEGLLVITGTIDPNYRGVVSVQCVALTKDIELKKGDRIAQIVFTKFEEPEMREARINVNETARGESGFGGSGGFTKG